MNQRLANIPEIERFGSVKLSREQYVYLAGQSQVFTIGKGNDALQYCIVELPTCIANVACTAEGYKLIWLSDPFTVESAEKSDDGSCYAVFKPPNEAGFRLPYNLLLPEKISEALYSKGIAINRAEGAEQAISRYLQLILSHFKPQSVSAPIGWIKSPQGLSWGGCLQRNLALGSVGEYFDTMSALVSGCLPLQFVLCSAAASILLAYLVIMADVPLMPFGLSLVGASSTGKTTAELLAASLFSAPNDKNVFSAMWGTPNALIYMLGRHQGVAFCYDEATIKNDMSYSNFVYTFSEGTDKLRLNPDGTPKVQRSWLCTTIFSSENYHIDPQRVEHLGLAARIITLDGLKYTKGSSHSEEVKFFAKQNHGIIAEELAASLLETDPQEVLRHYNSIRDSILKKMAACSCALTNRVSQNYAVIIMTAMLFNNIGIDFDTDGIINMCEQNHSFLSAICDRSKNLVIQIFNYICCDYRNLKGVKWTLNSDKKPVKVEIIEPTFENIVEKCGYSDSALAAKILLEDGYIVRPETGRRKTKVSIDGIPAYGYRFNIEKVNEAFGPITDAVYTNVKKHKAIDPFSDDVLDIVNDEEAIVHEGNYRIEDEQKAVIGKAHLLL